jgi:multisubunit Na+/H+ antiporter MnhG subunit
MREVPRRIAVLFLLAVGGVLFMLGAVLDRVAGRLALAVYVVLLVAPVVAGAVTASRRRSRLAAGRTCTCCTGTVHDPVQVI